MFVCMLVPSLRQQETRVTVISIHQGHGHNTTEEKANIRESARASCARAVCFFKSMQIHKDDAQFIKRNCVHFATTLAIAVTWLTPDSSAAYL